MKTPNRKIPTANIDPPTARENIICFGDSITEGVPFSEGCRRTALVGRHLETPQLGWSNMQAAR
ncbi:MAG: hypothetical protein WCH98_06200 [Verrucomicrobiota bacterium]